LFSDIQALKPTIFPSVPKLFSRIYDKVQLQISDAPAWKRHLFHMAVNSKIERLHKEGDSTHWFYDRLIFNKIKALLGGRVRVMITGSAPISPKVLEFMRM
jgi:long-chain acyl-CoA synthetase